MVDRFCPSCGGLTVFNTPMNAYLCLQCGPQWALTKPSVCADVAIVDGRERILVIQRARNPGRGKWALPGGFVEPQETAAAAAAREIWEEVGLGFHAEELHLAHVDLDGVSDAPGRVVVTYTVRLTEHREISPNPEEVMGARWCYPIDLPPMSGWYERAIDRALWVHGL